MVDQRQASNFQAISWREFIFLWDDDDVRFVLDHYETS